MAKKRLSVVSPKDQKLGRPTIMDRGLAQSHGAAYVHLAAFAIDVDRVRELDPEDGSLPFGWEVLITERYLAHWFDSAERDPTGMLEEACLAVMELPRPAPGELPPFGSQLPFAVYAGVARGSLPNALGSCFHAWKKPPVHLVEELAEIEKDPEALAKLVRHCLQAEVEPALVPPVKEALEHLLDASSSL